MIRNSFSRRLVSVGARHHCWCQSPSNTRQLKSSTPFVVIACVIESNRGVGEDGAACVDVAQEAMTTNSSVGNTATRLNLCKSFKTMSMVLDQNLILPRSVSNHIHQSPTKLYSGCVNVAGRLCSEKKCPTQAHAYPCKIPASKSQPFFS